MSTVEGGVDAAIREWLDPIPTVEQWGGWMRRVHGALTAVLDLHADAEAGFCRECSDEFPAASPCPTKRAIAEKLGVEVAGA